MQQPQQQIHANVFSTSKIDPSVKYREFNSNEKIKKYGETSHLWKKLINVINWILFKAAPNSPGSASTATTGANGKSNTIATNNNDASAVRAQINGGRFDFENGGTYRGGWDNFVKAKI